MWLFAFEDAPGIGAADASLILDIDAVAHQAAGCGELARGTNRARRVTERQSGELFALLQKNWTWTNHEATGSRLAQA